MRRVSAKALSLASLMVAGSASFPATPTPADGDSHAFTEDFLIEGCTFSSSGRNSYFVLEPGHQLILDGTEGKEEIRVVITVLNDTEVISGVRTRVVEEYETIDGALAEVSRNFFALCKETGNMFYFGEDVDIYENGEVVGHAGAWRAGTDGALPGVFVPGSPMLGARYFQEVAPNVALDRAEVLRLDAVVDTPVAVFNRCLETEETTPLEPNARDTKIYAPGVGLIVDGSKILVGLTPR
ncbi:MAG: hypothetical protein HYV63_02525 [Candidatus Schekmanbacteria bacterium]|nr:hypothetical protein [Candidatus Schekmanbacteria bacterium]